MRKRGTLSLTILGFVLLAVAMAVQTATVTSTPPAVGATATTVQVGAIKDNTLYEDSAGGLSNGAGQHLFAGKTGIGGGQKVRRGLIAFDVAGNLPADALIISATLTLHFSKAPHSRPSESTTISLHRVQKAWGEGDSVAPGEEGEGAVATPGDATWLHAVYSPTNSISWSHQGGDFVAGASATAVILPRHSIFAEPRTWGPTPQMTADISSWHHAPEENHGWLLLGDELEILTARRFDSRENPTPENRPFLSITYTLPSAWRYLPLITK